MQLGRHLAVLAALVAPAHAQSPEDRMDDMTITYASCLSTAAQLSKENRALKLRIAELEKNVESGGSKK